MEGAFLYSNQITDSKDGLLLVERSEVTILKISLESIVFFEIKRNTLAYLLMVRAPITDVELRLTVIPLNDIKLTLPTGLVLLENTDLFDDLISDFCLRHPKFLLQKTNLIA